MSVPYIHHISVGTSQYLEVNVLVSIVGKRDIGHPCIKQKISKTAAAFTCSSSRVSSSPPVGPPSPGTQGHPPALAHSCDSEKPPVPSLEGRGHPALGGLVILKGVPRSCRHWSLLSCLCWWCRCVSVHSVNSGVGRRRQAWPGSVHRAVGQNGQTWIHKTNTGLSVGSRE